MTSLEQGSNDSPKDFYVQPTEGSRLEGLQTLYDDAKKRAEAAVAEFEEVRDGLKAELTALQLPEGTNRVVLQGGNGRVPLVLKWKTSFRLDSRALKAADPGTYVKYGRSVGYWQLERL
jgi:hypothetical protein